MDAQTKHEDYWVECNVCKQHLKNWVGSTPCCGSIAYLVKDGKPTKSAVLFASINNSPVQPTEIDLSKPPFKKCGEGDNVCNCKNADECGYR